MGQNFKVVENYSIAQVSRKLRISHEQIRNKLNHQNVLSVVPSTPFVEMKTPSIKQ
ncbi:MAG: hypothetical protein HON32_03020 [Francisellaceae bacterium]|jgi:hypothetical protein|nr:hypothetical protein [Francisellaceae bacterium]